MGAPLDGMGARLQRVRQAHAGGRTRSRQWRDAQLRALAEMTTRHEGELLAAVQADLGKCAAEGWATELGVLQAEIRFVRRHLRRWMRPRRVGVPLLAFPGSAWILPEPLGVALILGAWNYPLLLTLSPLVGALAAGNCAVVKPSEFAPATAEALARLVPAALDADCVDVVCGGTDVAQELLAERFDKIFFTGSTAVGRIVMAAAAQHLTPVTLELGGKSPCIVTEDADLEVAGQRVAWGRFLNAGQTCVAPDHVYVHESVEAAFLASLQRGIERMFGADCRQSSDYGRIINDRHLARLRGLLDEGELVCGGQVDAEERYLAPTVLRQVPAGARVMQEEIFGPILPVLTYGDLDEAIREIRARPQPLSLYVFTSKRRVADHVAAETSSGSLVVNDCIVNLAVPQLPFGGVGDSGLGAYHGRHSFDAFSHLKAVLRRSTWFDVPLRYPPYGETKSRWLRRLL